MANKWMIVLGVMFGIRVTVAILNHNRKPFTSWIKKKLSKNKLNEQQLNAFIKGQSKLVMDYNILLQEIFKDGDFPHGKSTEEILNAAIEKIQGMRTPGDEIDSATILAEIYDKPSNINQYDLSVDEELKEINKMLDCIEDMRYLDIADKYGNDPQLFIVERCLVKRRVYLEKQKGDKVNDTK